MSATADVIVVGVGAMGAATCAALARRGVRVLGLEAGSIPNSVSSHHGHTRVFRVAYFEHADYVPLLRRAREAWIGLEQESGEPLYRECGVLYVGAADGCLITRTRAAGDAHGIALEVLGRSELRSRYPQFHAPESSAGLFEPRAGWVGAEAGVSALAASALRHGADLRAGEPMVGWSEGGGGVRVRTGAGEYSAGRLVLTAGAWAPRLLGGLGVGLRVTRQVLLWVWPRRPEMFGDDRFPVWAMETTHGLAYGFPFAPGRAGVKLALHETGAPVNPDQVSRELAPADRGPLGRVLSEYIPDAGGPVLAHAVCLYTNSPDGQFIIDRLPGSERVAFGAGFSGHGFKFAPVVGEALADLALGGRTDLPIGFLGLSRFGKGTST